MTTTPQNTPAPAAPPTNRLAAALHGLYKRTLSPFLHSSVTWQCKYRPTCSDYAYAAVTKHGWTKGIWLAAKRVIRCHPWAEGGHDPVP